MAHGTAMAAATVVRDLEAAACQEALRAAQVAAIAVQVVQQVVVLEDVNNED